MKQCHFQTLLSEHQSALQSSKKIKNGPILDHDGSNNTPDCHFVDPASRNRRIAAGRYRIRDQKGEVPRPCQSDLANEPSEKAGSPGRFSRATQARSGGVCGRGGALVVVFFYKADDGLRGKFKVRNLKVTEVEQVRDSSQRMREKVMATREEDQLD